VVDDVAPDVTPAVVVELAPVDDVAPFVTPAVVVELAPIFVAV
jgi:hypothetical protein